MPHPSELLPPGHVLYSNATGAQAVGDSLDLLAALPDRSIDLIVTSPPFPLLRKKSYGNEEQEAYVAWLGQFGAAARRVLKETGSFVLDVGGAYRKREPFRSLHQFRVLIDWCDRLEYRLAEEFYWHNPSKLPSPIEWVNKRKIRVKDSVNTVWWFANGEAPKADVRRVLVPYSAAMKRLLADPKKYYTPKDRPSEHSISAKFAKDNGGAIPSNLLSYPNSRSNSYYLNTCKALEERLGSPSHPARFPADLPRFFIEMLTEPGDVVLDIFSGSNTTGEVASNAGRRWLSFEKHRDYAAMSALRLVGDVDLDTAGDLVEMLRKEMGVDLGAYLEAHAGGEAPPQREAGELPLVGAAGGPQQVAN